jgi:zinc protease
MRRFLTRVLCVLALSAVVVVPAIADGLEDKITEFELDNGMKFIVIERHEAPVAFCAIGFKVGAIYESPGITGISHLLEHMLFK